MLLHPSDLKISAKNRQFFGGMKKIHFISFAFFDEFCDFSAKIS